VTVSLLALLIVGMKIEIGVTVHRQLLSISLGELPLLISLFYLPPLVVLTLRALAAVIDQAARRAGLVKACFNVALMAAGTACANAVVAAYGAPMKLHDPRSWLMLGAAVFAYSLTTVTAMGALTALMQGTGYLAQYTRAALINQISTGIMVVVGLVTLLALAQSKWSILLLGGLAVALVVVYRSYAQFERQHKSLAEIHEITKATANVPGSRLADAVLERLRSLVQAESATLWLPARGRYPEILLSATVDYKGLLDRPKTPDSIRRRAFDSGEPVTVGAKLNPDESTADLREKLRQLGTKDAIVVPLRSGDAVIGTLEIAAGSGPRRSSTSRTCGCWRPLPRTWASRSRTPAWSTASATTPTTTR